MSDATTVINNSNHLGVDYDVSKIFIFNNRYSKDVTFKNKTAGTKIFPAGTIVCRDSNDDTIVPFDNVTPANGDNIPVGVLAKATKSLAAAATETKQSFCNKGDVAQDKLLQEVGTLVTVATGTTRTVYDHLLSAGIQPVIGTEMTGPDNS